MTLKNICHNFSFKSAFILLANEDRTRLVPYAGTVSNRSEQQVVAPISTDLETTNVFSTVFHTGQSAIVELSEANNRLFCGQSRELVNYFQLNRFLVLVIEAQQKYGVLIAEKDGRNEPLGQTDVVLLNRIATQAAMALDKQSRIDNESKLRNLFQKYVPREIIESISQQNNQGRLGGEVRTIVAMILDIRGFTKLSHEVSPPMALELLNRFFSSLYKVVQDRHGLIDKFLGDGALVTWGAIGSRSPESQKENIQNAFYAANEMLDAMDILNDVFGDIGLPRINIGIGMHVGPAVVGNVGAEERLEFTSIGTTVNLASRLEQLSKELKSDLVVSADIINQLPPTETRHLVQAQHQVVRGLEQPVDVYYLKKTELKKAS